MGRFMSPDWAEEPEPVPYSKLDDPQSLNLYIYGMNNPLTIGTVLKELGGRLAQEYKQQHPN
jgi:hypothetical protein